LNGVGENHANHAIRVELLDWKELAITERKSVPSFLNQVDVLFGADLVYDYEPTDALVGALSKLLQKEEKGGEKDEKKPAECYLALKFRGYDPYNYLVYRLEEKGLMCEEITRIFPVSSYFEYDRVNIHLFQISDQN